MGNKNTTDFRLLTPNLMVDSVPDTIEFYRSHLDFDVVLSVPMHAPPSWACMKRGEVMIMFQQRDSIVEEYPLLAHRSIGGSLLLYFDVESIDALFAKVSEAAVVLKEPENTFYGKREFAIEDCNGYILTFSEQLN